jgi:hypothetical protein
LLRLQKRRFKFRRKKVNREEEELAPVVVVAALVVVEEAQDPQPACQNPKEEDQLQQLQRGPLRLAKAQQELLVLEAAPQQQQQERSTFQILFLALQIRIEKRSKKTKKEMVLAAQLCGIESIFYLLFVLYPFHRY